LFDDFVRGSGDDELRHDDVDLTNGANACRLFTAEVAEAAENS
jgi:hypothetical protein